MHMLNSHYAYVGYVIDLDGSQLWSCLAVETPAEAIGLCEMIIGDVEEDLAEYAYAIKVLRYAPDQDERDETFGELAFYRLVKI